MSRSWIATVAAAAVLTTLASLQVQLPAAADTAGTAGRGAAAGTAGRAGPAGPAVAAAGIPDHAVATRWTWAHRGTGSTATADQTIGALVSGLTTASRNGGFVLRRSTPDRYVLVSFSGTRYQVRLYSGTRHSLVVNKQFRPRSTGAARTEIRGNVIKSYWDGELLGEDTIPGLSTYPGTGTGVAVWQDRAAAVSLRSITLGLPTDVDVPGTPTTPPPPPAAQWRSGASGGGVADGRYGTWRGRPLDIAGTWNDGHVAQLEQWSVQPGAEYGAWQGDLDVAVGGIYADRGETWAAAAAGAYDARWRVALSRLDRAWRGKPGTLYIRFAHEFNGNWYPWSVGAGQTADFAAAWRRFRVLQLQEAPRHKLVFCPNIETSGVPGLDWRAAFPGTAYVDVMSVDGYNQYPFVTSEAAFASTINRVDGRGAPSGLEQHRRFAESVGLPFAVSEWSSNSTMGDSPVYVRQLHEWFSRNAGTGPGRLLYEVHFNVHHGDGRFSFFPAGAQPQAAAAYASLW